MRAYLNLVERIFKEGIVKDDRTGTGTVSIPTYTFEHNMEDGFPLLTTKKTPFKCIASELEFFLRGRTDKKWLQDRGNHIWDEWCNPKKVAYGTDEETKKKMKEEGDLGPVYGFQWRHFGAEYRGYDADYTGEGVDQLLKIVNALRENPDSRRMIVSSLNPSQEEQMAIPPCHYSWKVSVTGKRLNLSWDQRSVDTALGLPFNIASYALLLHLLAKQSGFKEGLLAGHLKDVHIYKNHIKGLKEQLKRTPYILPAVDTPRFLSIFDWEYTDTHIRNYSSHPGIQFEIAV